MVVECCMPVCLSVRLYVCKYVWTYMHVRMCVSMYACMYLRLYIASKSASSCMRLDLCMHTCVWSWSAIRSGVFQLQVGLQTHPTSYSHVYLVLHDFHQNSTLAHPRDLRLGAQTFADVFEAVVLQIHESMAPALWGTWQTWLIVVCNA